MTGWLLIIALLFLGGILSTLGDRLGTRIGKARLSIFKLRPKSTAVLITVLTGSLISAFSLGFMLLVDADLRVGLFQIRKLRAKEKKLEMRVQERESQLREFEKNIFALRSGNMVLSKNQILASSILKTTPNKDPKQIIDRLIQKANSQVFTQLFPGEKINRRVLFILKEDVSKLEKIIKEGGDWSVNIRSVGNVLLGDKRVLGFIEAGPNVLITKKGDILATTTLQFNDLNFDSINRILQLLLASTKTEVKRRGSLSNKFYGRLSSDLTMNFKLLEKLRKEFKSKPKSSFTLEAVAIKQSQTSDPIEVLVKLNRSNPKFENIFD